MSSPVDYQSIYTNSVLLMIAESDMTATKSRLSIETCSSEKMLMLMLYSYALSTWKQDSEGNFEQFKNCLTEDEVYAINSKLNLLK